MVAVVPYAGVLIGPAHVTWTDDDAVMYPLEGEDMDTVGWMVSTLNVTLLETTLPALSNASTVTVWFP